MGIFDWHCIDSLDQFKENKHFINVFLNYKLGISHHLFMSSIYNSRISCVLLHRSHTYFAKSSLCIKYF